jgi:hypothetical protein
MGQFPVTRLIRTLPFRLGKIGYPFDAPEKDPTGNRPLVEHFQSRHTAPKHGAFA